LQTRKKITELVKINMISSLYPKIENK